MYNKENIINLDILLIKLFLNSTELYDKYGQYVGKKHNGIYTKAYHIVKAIKRDGKATHKVEDFILKAHVLYPMLSSSDAEAFAVLAEQLGQANVEVTQATELLNTLKEREFAERLALKAVEVVSQESTMAELLALASEIKANSLDLSLPEENPFVTDNLAEIKEKALREPPFKFRLKTLNQILGGLRRRTFGFLFARPEIGKTQFLASEGTFLAPQCKNCLLWINNEEDGTALVTRCYQASLERDSYQLFKDVDRARRDYEAKIGGKIKIYDRPTANDSDIRSVVRKYQPDIIFIDQLDKVHGFRDNKERYDLLQKAKYQWARELAKEFNCAVVGICQAGGSAENKRFLDMNDVDSSHTAKQGEADWMIGMGATDKIGEEEKRFLSICKNKLQPTEDMVPEMRHAKVPILSKPDVQLYEDVLSVNR